MTEDALKRWKQRVATTLGTKLSSSVFAKLDQDSFHNLEI